MYPEGSLANIEPIAALFFQQTGIKINFLQTTVDDINTKLFITAAKQSEQFDIALPATFGIPDLVEAKALADLTGLAREYETKVHYKPSLYDLGDRYKERKYGYQTDGDAYLMFYNTDYIHNEREKKSFEDKYGYQLELPTTWEELDILMKFYHRPGQNTYGGCLFRTPRYMVWEWWIRFHAKGYYPVKDDMTPNIDNDYGVAALEELIRASEYLHPSVKTNGLFENWSEFAKGHSFVNIGWGGTQKYLNSHNSKIKEKLVHTPTPGVSYFNWGWNYVVSNFSSQKEIAYLFCLYATLPEISKLAVKQQNGFFDPFREEHYQDTAVEKAYGKAFLKAHKSAMQSAIPDFYIEGQGQYIEVLQQNIANTFEGVLSAKKLCKSRRHNGRKLPIKLAAISKLSNGNSYKSNILNISSLNLNSIMFSCCPLKEAVLCSENGLHIRIFR